jgi:hypothetical protein
VNGNKYETALQEVRSVLGEWLDLINDGERIDSPHSRNVVAGKIVDRLVAKGLIQSTDPDDLRNYRTGPLTPGRTIIGGVDDEDRRAHEERVREAADWALNEHAETLRRLGESGEGPTEHTPGSVMRSDDGEA